MIPPGIYYSHLGTNVLETNEKETKYSKDCNMLGKQIKTSSSSLSLMENHSPFRMERLAWQRGEPMPSFQKSVRQRSIGDGSSASKSLT